jgi:hypothetical protein
MDNLFDVLLNVLVCSFMHLDPPLFPLGSGLV